jgi:anti-anti-sigma factor
MLDISYEFRRGFFFVRLSGDITKKNYNIFIKELNIIIKRIGLNKIVLNIDSIKSIDVCCLNNLLKYLKKITYKGILILICDSKACLSEKIFKNIIPRISYETEVYNLI